MWKPVLKYMKIIYLIIDLHSKVNYDKQYDSNSIGIAAAKFYSTF